MKDLFLREVMFHVVDGVADDERDEDFDDVVEDGRDPAPGEMLPISPEVGCERLQFVKHIWLRQSFRSDEVRDSEDAELFPVLFGLREVAELQVWHWGRLRVGVGVRLKA